MSITSHNQIWLCTYYLTNGRYIYPIKLQAIILPISSRSVRGMHIWIAPFAADACLVTTCLNTGTQIAFWASDPFLAP